MDFPHDEFRHQSCRGLTIWLGFNRPLKDGLITFVPGMLAGEIKIFTVPNRAAYNLRAYKRRYVTGVVPKHDDDVNWFLAACPGGLVAGLHFKYHVISVMRN